MFPNFCVEIENQFSMSICVLRSDNEKEFFSSSFENFKHKISIVHQSSCSYTQKNDIVERKSRHLLHAHF